MARRVNFFEPVCKIDERTGVGSFVSESHEPVESILTVKNKNLKTD